jgi:eukaryotic-like serine/threonine-protein kinase
MTTDGLSGRSPEDRVASENTTILRLAAAPPRDPGDRLSDPSTVAFRLGRTNESNQPDGLDSWVQSLSRGSCPIGGGWGLGQVDGVSGSVRQMTKAANSIPEAGEDFLGFRLIEELGRGAFGRVFLARQGDLAGRQVVLKIAAEVEGETRALAQLQHTYIVPIYSVHPASPLQAFCMPYFGGTTLGHVLADVINRDGLPESGRHLLTSLAERSRSRKIGLEHLSVDPSQVRPPLPAGPSLREESANVGESVTSGTTPTTLRMYAGMSYVHSILWILGCLSEGLAHAHERGVLHRDLKPANILLTDDGRPMLLDFNLSENINTASALASTSIGGTIPYMAPEHLDAIRGGTRPVDVRSDVYSLGVILHEMLTGRSPYPKVAGATLDDLVRERSTLPEDPRRWNPSISPAVASIVLHCLEPEPGRRYQSALQLHEDLTLQLGNNRLRHAPDPSIRERVGKWSRRHPRLTSSGTVGAVGAAISLALAIGIGVHLWEARRTLEASTIRGLFGRDLDEARLTLNTSGVDAERRESGVAACRRALDRYSAREGRPLAGLRTVRYLSVPDRDRLPAEVGEALWLLARATWLGAGGEPDNPGVETDVLEALRLNRLSEACFPQGQVPPVLWSQRAEFVAWLGRRDEAEGWSRLAERSPPRSAFDLYLAAGEEAARGRYSLALPSLDRATRLDPKLYWGWFLKGACHDREGQDVDALACYQACIALEPGETWPYFNRGLVRLRRKEFRQALADFESFITRQPGRFEPYLDRSLAWHGLGRADESLRDIDEAIRLGSPKARAYFMRARVNRDKGDDEGARRDLESGMSFTPTDEPSWIARGLARAATAPQAALDDFQEALKLNPRSLAALQNTASLLSDQPDRVGEAVAVLDRALATFPDYVPARSGRGVLLARLGRREEALRDAEESLRRDTSPPILYQVAGIYARTSPRHPDDALHAIRLLASALRSGFGWDQLEDDRDLDPIRDSREFLELVRAARSLKTTPSAL